MATGCDEVGVSFGGVISFIVSLAFKNSSSSSVAQEFIGVVVPYLSSVVILCIQIKKQVNRRLFILLQNKLIDNTI